MNLDDADDSIADDPSPNAWLKLERRIHRNIRAKNGEGALFLVDRLIGEGCDWAYRQKAAIYEYGVGTIPEDKKKAVEWYKRSVEKLDDVVSHQGLARIYLASSDLDPSASLAEYHLSALADSDDTGGYYGLGLMYQHGMGRSVDLRKASEYFSVAASRGHLGAKLGLYQVDLASEPTWRAIFLGALFATLRKIYTLIHPNSPRIGIG